MQLKRLILVYEFEKFRTNLGFRTFVQIKMQLLELIDPFTDCCV